MENWIAFDFEHVKVIPFKWENKALHNFKTCLHNMIKGNYCLYLYFGSNVWGDVDILIASSDIYNRQNIYSVIASF